ncbi:MAG: hypothetical protein RR846_08970, partial [Oscillospiraceae bacterium]
YSYYGCNARYRKHSIDCTNKDIAKDYIEGCILEKLSEYVFNDDCIPTITKEYNKFLLYKNKDYNGKIKVLQNQLKQINSDIEKVIVLLMQTSSKILIEKLENYEKEKTIIDTKLKTLTEDNKKEMFLEKDIKVVFSKIRNLLANANIKNIQQIIDAYIDKIIVYPNEIKVQLNFFPNFSLKLDEKEKDCPITEGILDLQGQSNSRTINKNADRIGAAEQT